MIDRDSIVTFLSLIRTEHYPSYSDFRQKCSCGEGEHPCSLSKALDEAIESLRSVPVRTPR